MTGYVNPFAGAKELHPERIDMGVDYSMAPGSLIAAIGEGRVTAIEPNWYAGQPLLAYQLTSGPMAGKSIYLAEQIEPLVAAGEHIKAGQPIARYAPSGTGIETGWAQASGEPLAKVAGGYREGELTTAGREMSAFLERLGAPGGTTEGRKAEGSANPLGLISGPISAGASLAGEVAGGIGSLIAKGAGAADEAAGSAAKAGGELVGREIVEAVRPTAEEITLYAVLLLGGAGLVIMGVLQLFNRAPARPRGIAATLRGPIARAGAST